MRLMTEVAVRCFFMAMLLSVLPACESQTSLMYGNPSLSDTKEGLQCLRHLPFGVGRQLDLSGNEAMHQGSMTRARTVVYQVDKFHGVGTECVIARGE